MKEVLLSFAAASPLFADALPNTYPFSGEHLALTRGSSWESHGRNEITSANKQGQTLKETSIRAAFG